MEEGIKTINPNMEQDFEETEKTYSQYSNEEWKEPQGNDAIHTTTPKKPNKKTSSKVAVSLASNLSASVVPYSDLEEMFSKSDIGEHYTHKGELVKFEFRKDVLQINGDITQELQDKSYKPVRLTNQEQKLCYALSYLLTVEEEFPSLKFRIDESESGSEDPLFVPLDINASTISKIMTGETRTRYKNIVGELLKSISQKVNVFKCPYKKRTRRDEEQRTLLFSFPLIVSKGFIEEAGIDKNGNPTKNFIGMKAELLRPFFNNIRSQNTPLNPSIFKLWVDSSLFANLFSKLNELWFYSWVGYNKAKADVLRKYGKVKADKVPEIEEEIHKTQYERITRTLDFDTIAKLSEDDYTSTKQKRLRFRKDLEKCLNRFIEYGIVTSGKILPDKKQAIFIMNPNFKGDTEGRVIEVNGKDKNQ